MAIQLLCPVHQVGRIIGQVALISASPQERRSSAALYIPTLPFMYMS